MSQKLKRSLPERYAVVETVDDEWMILIDGIQWGRDRDASGAGRTTFPTEIEALAKALQLAKET